MTQPARTHALLCPSPMWLAAGLTLLGAACGDDEPCPQRTVVAGSVEIFAYEASRPGASGSSTGSSGSRACSGPGVLPWTEVTRQEAADACAGAGFRLCTNPEWQRACGGPHAHAYPYGGTEKTHVCADFLDGASHPSPGGAKGGCVSSEGVYDMVGGVWEWVLPTGAPPGGSGGAVSGAEVYVGGSYKVTAAARSLHPNRCSSQLQPTAGAGYQADDVGFRCCR